MYVLSYCSRLGDKYALAAQPVIFFLWIGGESCVACSLLYHQPPPPVLLVEALTTQVGCFHPFEIKNFCIYFHTLAVFRLLILTYKCIPFCKWGMEMNLACQNWLTEMSNTQVLVIVQALNPWSAEYRETKIHGHLLGGPFHIIEY